MGQDQTLSRLQDLDPEISQKALYLVAALRLSGLPAIITSGKRSLGTQLGLYGKGRWLPGNIVTNTVYGSKHLQGKAFDLGFSGFSADDLPDEWWQAIGNYAETRLGLKWGGRWKSIVDKVHFYV